MRGRISCAVVGALLLAGIGTLAHADSGTAAVHRPLILDVTGWRHQAASAPLPTASDGIGPGSYLLITTTATDDFGAPAQFICTANFVWDGWGGPYLGAAGHCFLPEDKDAYVGSDPYVTQVEVCVSDCAFGGQLGAAFAGTLEKLGPVVYARQKQGDADVGHDFGLVQIPWAITKSIRSTMPVWGGPTGVGHVEPGSPVCLYGNSDGFGETFPTKGRFGIGVSEDEGAWTAVMPSFEGDSGSAVENCAPGSSGLNGTTAAGILTHLIVGAGDVAGTTVDRAVQMVADELRIEIAVRHG